MRGELAGKVVLLTGGTEGIGRAAAAELAKRGARLSLVARNRDKAERVVAELKQESGNPEIRWYLADLANPADISALCVDFAADHDRLDVLINNAGGFFPARQHTSSGVEMTFALNHLAPFQLTTQLSPLLCATPGARVVTTASGMHHWSSLDLDSVAKRPGRYSGSQAYADSKLGNILFTAELARRLKGAGVTATSFHPGWVHTGISRNTQHVAAKVYDLCARVFARTPQKGAETLVWLATQPAAEQVSGGYFMDKRQASRSTRSRDSALAAGLWALSERLSQPQPAVAVAPQAGSARQPAAAPAP